jgi:trehalose/maltose hydrolase-like predicted phosphorylase
VTVARPTLPVPQSAFPAELDRRFEAIVCCWKGTAVADPAVDGARLRAPIEEASALGLHLAVVARADAVDVAGRLGARPNGPGRLYVVAGGGSEMVRVGGDGPERVDGTADDGADAARWVFAELARLGIAPGLVLIAGSTFGPPGSDAVLLVPEADRATAVSVGREPSGTPPRVVALGGGPERFLELLADQLDRRRRGDPPEVDGDPAWSVTIDGVDPELERIHESLLTLADGRIGTRGTPPLSDAGSRAGVVAAGVYGGSGPETDLEACAQWTRLVGKLPADPLLRRSLDLRTGTLRQELALLEGELSAFELSSLAAPGTVALRAEGPRAALPPGGRRSLDGGLVAAVSDRRGDGRLERIGVYARDEDTALAGLDEAERAGFERLLSAHRAAWAERWERADVVIEGDADLQHAVRFSLFHLMGSVASEGEAAVGARGVSGPAYRGHVFWDSDVFVLPFLAATHPPAARAMLEYRVRRLEAAKTAAKRLGRAGARWPWESAGDGLDVTPLAARLPDGRVVRIRTGELEEHIVADVAWAASCYLEWTGDEEFAAGPGRDLIVEGARYWASRLRYGRDGRAHVYGVIGPDEYHEPVDDNAFTNVMARWNLRRAADVDGTDDERDAWLAAADALVDGYDPASGLYEQFAGFFGLEPLVIADVAPRRPIAADMLLGPERTRAAQVVKQADVLMLHHLVPGEVAAGSLEPNLEFYEPRTAHGSSLSPAIHAALLARVGRFDDALWALGIAARLDLEDRTGTTAGGLHLATMGGVWQALAYGFAGVRPDGAALVVDPRLPPQWSTLELRLRFRGAPLSLRIDHEGPHVDSAAFRLERRGDHWGVVLR